MGRWEGEPMGSGRSREVEGDRRVVGLEPYDRLLVTDEAEGDRPVIVGREEEELVAVGVSASGMTPWSEAGDPPIRDVCCWSELGWSGRWLVPLPRANPSKERFESRLDPMRRDEVG